MLHTTFSAEAQDFLALHNKLVKLNDNWMTDIRQVHQAYIDSGCMCRHHVAVNEKRAQLKDTKITYNQLHRLYAEAKRETGSASNEMKVLEHTFKQSVGVLDHARAAQKKAGRKQKDFKSHGIATIGALLARAESSFESKAEGKSLRADVLEAERRLAPHRDAYVQAAYRYINRRDWTLWAKMFLRKSSVSYSGIDGFVKLEEEWGVAKWRNARDAEMFVVASRGLEGLICKHCNGWKWAISKVSLAEVD